MSVLPLLIIVTTVIFAAGIFVQRFTRLKFCAVCVAVSGTWLALLGLLLLGFAVNPTLLGVLMGESVVGLYYLLERKAPPAWQLFRWPYIISATVAVLLIVGIRSGAFWALIFLTIIWAWFACIYLFQQYPAFKKIMERLMACCRNW